MNQYAPVFDSTGRLMASVARVPTPEEHGRAARERYKARCAERGVEYDPIAADEEYYRAKRAAEGRTYYAGD